MGRACVGEISGVSLCSALLCYFCVFVLWQSGVWADDFTLVPALLTHPLVLCSVAWGWSLLITLIAFLGFGLWEALEEYQKRGAFMPFVPLLQATAPSSTAAKLAEAVSLGFSLSRRGMAVASCYKGLTLTKISLPYLRPFKNTFVILFNMQSIQIFLFVPQISFRV